jgi:hypothetical protein
MNPGLMLLANSSFPVSLYDFHLDGVSARELATAYSLPLAWVEERLEAVRLCLKYQVAVSLSMEPAGTHASPRQFSSAKRRNAQSRSAA